MVSQILEDDGHTVTTFIEGGAALDFIKSNLDVNLLITSAELDEMSGLELCQPFGFVSFQWTTADSGSLRHGQIHTRHMRSGCAPRSEFQTQNRSALLAQNARDRLPLNLPALLRPIRERACLACLHYAC